MLLPLLNNHRVEAESNSSENSHHEPPNMIKIWSPSTLAVHVSFIRVHILREKIVQDIFSYEAEKQNHNDDDDDENRTYLRKVAWRLMEEKTLSIDFIFLLIPTVTVSHNATLQDGVCYTGILTGSPLSPRCPFSPASPLIPGIPWGRQFNPSINRSRGQRSEVKPSSQPKG